MSQRIGLDGRVKPRPGGATIRFRTGFRNTIYDVLRGQGWKEMPLDADVSEWDFIWSDTSWIRETLDHVHLAEHQRVNHFRNHYELTRKDMMVKNLKRMKKQLERDGRAVEAAKYDFFPATFVVPAE